MSAFRFLAAFGGILLLCTTADAAFAQNTTSQILTNQPARVFDTKTMNFDLWCQQTQQYPIERCEMRLPTDVKAFEDYRDAVERYELQYLQQADQNRAEEARGNRDPTQTDANRQDAPIQ